MYTALPCRTERIPLIWHPRLGLDQFRTHTRIIQRIFVRIKAETPVIGTRVGGIPEIVKDEETGLLVPSHNEKALAQRIIRLLSDENLFHRLVYQALQLVKTQFSVEEHVRKIEQIYTRFSRSESFLEKGGNIKP
ncbi:MAG: glycosyltransferase [Candidatus Vecturithrix sp.]|nr:glycosyltransferase [Candidatus Vecturithrix sp.]